MRTALIRVALVASASLGILGAQEVLAPEAPRSKPGVEPKDKAKPAPRLADGKVDLGGKGVWAPIWVLDWSDTKYVLREIPSRLGSLRIRLPREQQGSRAYRHIRAEVVFS